MLSPATTTRSARVGEPGVRRLGLAGPVGPPGGDHVLDGRAVAGQPGQLDVEPAPASASANPRIEDGLPVKPCSTSTPDRGVAAVRRRRGATRLGAGEDAGARSSAWPTFYRSGWCPVRQRPRLDPPVKAVVDSAHERRAPSRTDARIDGDRQHTEHGRERKQQLIDAAAELFAANGYAATRIQDICRRAGVAKGLFYWYFPTKQELFAELVRTMRTAAAQGPGRGDGPRRPIR